MHRLAPIAALFALACDVDPSKTESATTPTTTDTGETEPEPIAAVGIMVRCNKAGDEVTFTPDITGTPAEALLNASDFANETTLQEENNFEFDDDGVIQPLVLETTGFSTPGEETGFDCAAQLERNTDLMTYVLRLYDADETLADCAAGAEEYDAQKFLDAMGATDLGLKPTAPEEFASCETDLVISY